MVGVNHKRKILTLSWSFDWISFMTSNSSFLAMFGRRFIYISQYSQNLEF